MYAELESLRRRLLASSLSIDVGNVSPRIRVTYGTLIPNLLIVRDFGETVQVADLNQRVVFASGGVFVPFVHTIARTFKIRCKKTKGSPSQRRLTPVETALYLFQGWMEAVTMEAGDSGVMDPALGSPLDLATANVYSDVVDRSLRPWLYRLYVAAHILRLSTETRYAALVYLHRYAHTQQPMNRWVAAACLLLATKSQEEPRRLRDFINLAEMILGAEDVNESLLISMEKDPPPLDDAYWERKKKLVETEQTVLRWLGFDVFVPHPHRVVVLLTKHLPLQQRKSLALVAGRILNDGLFHGKALRHTCVVLGAAAVDLASREVSLEDSFPEGWWTPYNISKKEVETTIHDLTQAMFLLKGTAAETI